MTPCRNSLQPAESPFMLQKTILILCVLTLPFGATASEPVPTSPAIKFGADDWPWWRGPHNNGIASADQQPPTQWSESQNVVWRTPIPGRGHGSATVVGERIYLATAEPDVQKQGILCIDRRSGKEIWSTVVHSGGFPDPDEGRGMGNRKASMASGTVACDGSSLFICFLNSGAIRTSALDLNGKLKWQTKISDYVVHQGYGASPALYQHLVIVAADNKSGGAVAGLDRNTGKIVWKRDRPEKPNYASPVILNVAGKDQLLFTGCDLVTSLDPLTGNVNWEVEGATTECVTTTVTDGTHVFTSGGYPENHISAVTADGSGQQVWKNKSREYVPSMLSRDGYLYTVLDAGIIACLKSDTGEEMWKQRLAGNFSSSPVFVGDLIYASNEEGTTFVLKATPDECEKVATNRLGDNVFATPTICGSRIYARVAHNEGDRRQEYLYCLGAEADSEKP